LELFDELAVYDSWNLWLCARCQNLILIAWKTKNEQMMEEIACIIIVIM